MTDNNIYNFNNARRQDQLSADIPDAADIKARIDVRKFVEWLFSGRAICSKHEARIGSIHGEAGESLSISLTGDRAGCWYDHATGENGDIFGLFMAHLGYSSGDFPRALKEIQTEFLCDTVSERDDHRLRDYIKTKKEALGDKPKKENLELGPPLENYGYYGRDGKVILVGRRYEPGGVDENGKPKKAIRYSSWPVPRPLYRIPHIVPATRVVFTEGERKADALYSFGIEATSAMGGANQPLEKTDWSPLAGKHVTIWPDNDPQGAEFASKVATLLSGYGCTVCMVENPPGKPKGWDAYDCIQEGGDPHALLKAAKPIGAAPADRNVMRILTLDDIEALPPLQWVFNGWITTDSIGFVYGEPGCGKSFFVLDWCLHLAYMLDRWHGATINHPGPILYLLQEGGRGIVNRVKAFKKYYGIIDNPKDFQIMTYPLSFLDQVCLSQLLALVESSKQDNKMIVIDTVSRVLPGADENLQKDMTHFIRACDRLRIISSACVVGVHHAGKSGDLRGSTVLRGAGDFVYKLEKDRGVNPITVTCEKQKDEEDGWQKTFQLVKVEIEERSEFDFNPIKSSLVIGGMEEGPGPGYGRAEDAVLKALELSDREMSATALLEVVRIGKVRLYEILKKLVEENLVSVSEGKRGRNWKRTKTKSELE